LPAGRPFLAEHFDVRMSDLFLGGCVALGIDSGLIR
jgi:hypothetical protein